MAALRLIIGNRNYSSWSLRAWLMAVRTGEAVETEVIALDQPDTRERLADNTPAGLVPVLKADGLTIWDTLAIGEYLAETYPDAGLWPRDLAARAMARSVSAEMHSGFQALRGHMPMDMRAEHPGKGRTDAVVRDIDRIFAIWSHCLFEFGLGQGPFLFGTWSIADAMFAPVVSRFRTYGVEGTPDVEAYMDAVWKEADLQAWLAEAEAEPWVIEHP